MEKNPERKAAETVGLFGPIPPEIEALDDVNPDAGGERLPTLAEIGKVLPTGFVDTEGRKHLDFETVDWTYEVEEALGEIAEKDRKIQLGTYMSEVIGAGLSRLGSIDVRKLKRSERRLLVRRLYFADALYVYVWVRIAAEGYALRLKKVECNRCGNEFPEFAADLRTIEVKTFPAGVPSRTVDLEHGVEYAGKRLKRFTLGPIRWSFLEDSPDALMNPAKLKLVTIQQGVVGLEGAPEGPVRLTAEHLRTMRTTEINRLVGEIDKCNGGPVMEVSDRCPKCKRTFSLGIPWTYDNFFASSSQ